jgi:glycosyltransferase involved in cell wall biosynthesis
MRILQIAPLWERVPPPAYGGTEAVVGLLADELVRRGHDVTLAASGDSRTLAGLHSVYPRSLRLADDLVDRNPYDWVHLASALAIAGDYDIVHNHAGELVMALAGLINRPMLTTAHCLTTPDTDFVWERYAGAYNTISRAQHRSLPHPPRALFVGHVYNAIDVESFPFQAKKGDDLLFLSRIAPEKGPHLAIEVARRTGRRLLMAGKVDRYDRAFHEEVVRPLIDGEQIVFLGEADAARKRELYRQAACVLLPLQWEEPFGLVMPEAMACGTPVIALRRGSAPELISHGETGYVVETVAEMADCVAAASRIDPARCREHVRQRFAPAIMAEGYERAYADVIEGVAARRLLPAVHLAPRGPEAATGSVPASA